METTRIANNRKNLYRLLIIVTLCMLFNDLVGQALASTLETTPASMEEVVDASLSESYGEVYEAETTQYLGELSPDALQLNKHNTTTNNANDTNNIAVATASTTSDTTEQTVDLPLITIEQVLDYMLPESITDTSAKEPMYEYVYYNDDVTYKIPNADTQKLEEQNFIDGITVRAYEYDSQTMTSKATDYENFYRNFFLDNTTKEAERRVEIGLASELSSYLVADSQAKLGNSYETLLPLNKVNASTDFDTVLNLLESDTNYFNTSFNIAGKFVLNTHFESLRDFKEFLESHTDDLIAQNITGDLYFIQPDSEKTSLQTINEVFINSDIVYTPFGTNPRVIKVSISNLLGKPKASISELDYYYYTANESEELADYISHDLVKSLKRLKSENTDESIDSKYNINTDTSEGSKAVK